MSKNKGFTLIELSIVLVIIGLIVGGVFVGKDLVDVAKTRKFVSESRQYETGINAFLDKYKCLPGDCRNASVFLGTPASQNGNNDRMISPEGAFDGTPLDAQYSSSPHVWTNEGLWGWRHLGTAGLIAGNFTGTRTGASSQLNIGVDNPDSIFDIAGYLLLYRSEDGRDPTPANSAGNYLQFGTKSPPPGVPGLDSGTAGGVFSPAFAREIDIKIDDGLARSGRFDSLASLYWEGGTLVDLPPSDPRDCINTSTNDYRDSDLVKTCRVFFRLVD